MPHMSYRIESRKNYGKTFQSVSDNASIEQLNCGSLMRIADSLEIIQQTYKRLIDERDQAIDQKKALSVLLTRSDNKIRALKGVITKMKKKDLNSKK